MPELRSHLSVRIIIAVFLILLCSGCNNFRRHREAEQIIRLLKNGEYAQVKDICHYNPAWDPEDSIFNQNVHFIHAYLNHFGLPRRADYKDSTEDFDGTNIIKVTLDKVSLFDTTLKSAYIELEFFNPSADLSEMSSLQKSLYKISAKLGGPRVDNFYLIRVKKWGKLPNYKID